ncbi:MAG TPA: outer membrane beta-barrel protein, partial [Methylobacterium sp.]
TTSFDFDNAGRAEAARILRNTTVESEFNVSSWNRLKPGRGHGLSYGGFAGYNLQFEDTVFGVELDYTSLNQKARSSDSIDRFVTTSTGYFTDVFVQTDSRATLQDYGTVRARGGYAIGSFMPFATGGLAIGRALVGSNVTVGSFQYTDSTRTTSVGALLQSGGNLKEKFALGFTAGAGIDFSITQNIFLRAEYQYILFEEFGDHRMHLSTIRSALGVKF